MDAGGNCGNTVRVGRPLLQDGVGGNHLPRDQVLADAEMFQRSLGLGTPELIGWNINRSQAIRFLPKFIHGSSSKKGQSRHHLPNTGTDALFVGENLVFKVTGIRDGRLGADAGIPAR